jgi:peptidoglycan hydrolase-like protein with peptidoglycan-binding domain
VFLDKPSGARRAAEAEAASDREQQRRLDYERQSELQREETRRQIEEQRLFEEWKTQRASGVTGAAAANAQVAAVNQPADVTAAQRLLTALGYYNGPADGQLGAQTRSAVMQFEANQGLPQTGVITPSIVSRMRASL